MYKQRFNAAAVREKYPRLLESIQGFDHPGINNVRRHLREGASMGMSLRLYDEDYKEILSAEIGFTVMTYMMRYAGLHLVLQTLRDNNIAMPWHSVSFEKYDRIQKSDLMLMGMETSKIAEYAAMDFREALAVIKPMPADKHMDEIYRALLGATATVKSPDIDSLIHQRNLDWNLEGPQQQPS